MQRQQLRKLIGDLHTELSTAEQIDDDSRELLQQLAGDIETLTVAESPEAGHHESAVDQLEEAVVKFETDHPRLSMVLGEILDALGKLGI
jgi:hypothetical protein